MEDDTEEQAKEFFKQFGNNHRLSTRYGGKIIIQNKITHDTTYHPEDQEPFKQQPTVTNILWSESFGGDLMAVVYQRNLTGFTTSAGQDKFMMAVVKKDTLEVVKDHGSHPSLEGAKKYLQNRKPEIETQSPVFDMTEDQKDSPEFKAIQETLSDWTIEKQSQLYKIFSVNHHDDWHRTLMKKRHVMKWFYESGLFGDDRGLLEKTVEAMANARDTSDKNIPYGFEQATEMNINVAMSLSGYTKGKFAKAKAEQWQKKFALWVSKNGPFADQEHALDTYFRENED